MGIHEFTYSLLPHQAALADSEVFAQAEDLNQPLYPMKGTARSRLRQDVLLGSG